ncbi:hypothetical protein JCM3766R1_002213 [Sporobolomyces carnicolor]
MVDGEPLGASTSTSNDDGDRYSDAVEELAGLGISREPVSSRTGAEPARLSTRATTSPPSSPSRSLRASPNPSHSPSASSIVQPAPSSATRFTAGSIPLPPQRVPSTEIVVQAPTAFPSPTDDRDQASFASSNDRRRPSLGDSQPSPRTHRNSPGAKNYFPIVGSSKGAQSQDSDSQLDRDSAASSAPSNASPRRSSIFPTVKPPSQRPTPSNVFPLVKSPSSNSTGAKTSANPFPFAEPPLAPTPTSPTKTAGQRRPSIAPSTSSSHSGGGGSSSSGHRVRDPSSATSTTSNGNPQLPRSPSSSSAGWGRGTPSIASTRRSPAPTNYAPSVAPSSEGPTSIFATPVGYKPARSLAGLILTKPSAIVSGSSSSSDNKETKKSKFSSFLSPSKKQQVEKGVTAPQHLIAGPQRSTSNRLLDAALTTSQTWAIRRGEQMMAPTNQPFASPMVGTGGGGGGGGGGAPFAYRPGHQIRREQEAAAAARAGTGSHGNGNGIRAEELTRRLEVERDASVLSPNQPSSSIFPTVNKQKTST